MKKMDTISDRNNKVSKALLEKRQRPVSSHINLTQEEVDNLSFHIESLSHQQKQDLIPIVKEFSHNQGDTVYSFNI